MTTTTATRVYTVTKMDPAVLAAQDASRTALCDAEAVFDAYVLHDNADYTIAAQLWAARTAAANAYIALVA